MLCSAKPQSRIIHLYGKLKKKMISTTHEPNEARLSAPSWHKGAWARAAGQQGPYRAKALPSAGKVPPIASR